MVAVGTLWFHFCHFLSDSPFMHYLLALCAVNKPQTGKINEEQSSTTEKNGTVGKCLLVNFHGGLPLILLHLTLQRYFAVAVCQDQ